MRQHHTDETVPALDLTDHLPTGPTPPARNRRRNRFVAAGLAIALVSGAAAAVALGGGSSSSPAASGTGVTRDAAELVSDAPTGTVPTGPQTETADQGPVQPQPQPEPEPDVPAEPGILAVSSKQIHLADGVYAGSFAVRNDGGSPIHWQWAKGDYGIGVSLDGSTLQPGEQVVVNFWINPFQVPEGDFFFGNSVYTDDAAKDVWIYGHRTPIVVNPDLDLPEPKLTIGLDDGVDD